MTGDPNGAAAPSWPAYTRVTEAYLDLGQPTQTASALHADHCEAMGQRRVAP
jgi:hypothetical protein